MQLTNLQLDALREIGSIGTGHISTCLSQLAEEKIIPIVPEVKITPLTRLNELIASPKEVSVGISLRLLGESMGKLVMIFSYDNALSILNETLKNRDSSTTTISESELLYFEKIGQIITSTYTNVLSQFLGILLVSYLPNAVIYKGDDFLKWLIQELGVKKFFSKSQIPQDSSYIDSILYYQVTFNKSPFLRFWGSFLLVFDLQTLKIILMAVNKLIKETRK